MIATDVDGTLINTQKMIPSYTRDQLQRVVREYGVGLILVSTRMPASLRQIQRDLEVYGPSISYSGALVADLPDSTFSIPISDSTSSRLIRELLAHPIHVGVFSYDKWFVSELDYWADREARGTQVMPDAIPLRTALDAGIVFPVHKVMMRGESTLLYRAVGSCKEAFPDVSCIMNNDTIAEVTHRDATKGAALQYVLNRLDIHPTKVIAFGDSFSDISMLKLAGLGIAVQNATVEVRAAVVETTLSNDDDGIGHALEKYFPL